MTTCRVCAEPFEKQRMGQIVCGLACARRIPAVNRKAERETTRKRKEAIKPRSKWLQEAQAVANRYARLRDQRNGLGCVSCDLPPSWGGQWHGSHFRSVGAASAVRLNLWNIHQSCSPCNKWKSGNLSEYEPRLRQKIGNDKVDWLRSQNQVVRYSVEYLKRYKAVFSKKCARMEKRIQDESR